jgi:epoxyqueuosine reductase
MQELSASIKQWGLELGFNQIGITDTNLQSAESEHQAWVEKGFHGEMDYMAKHGTKRTRPAELVPNTLRVISVRLDYLPPNAANSEAILNDTNKAFISRYTLGRDYHKVMRNKLQKLCEKIQTELTSLNTPFPSKGEGCGGGENGRGGESKDGGENSTPFTYRVLTDSAPVLEVALAEKSGLGWRGKHTLLINKDRGSWFFLGEIYTNLPLAIDAPATNHCGTCTSCMQVCPTQAIVAPYEVDARRCISYLTIELKGSIPTELRPLIGNRVYGCDDCQLFCPWNKFAEITKETDFAVRNGLDDISLVDCFKWTEEEFKANMAGSAIYRIGYEQWLRNIAIGLGNAKTSNIIIEALKSRADHTSRIVYEHVNWALNIHLKNS